MRFNKKMCMFCGMDMPKMSSRCNYCGQRQVSQNELLHYRSPSQNRSSEGLKRQVLQRTESDLLKENTQQNYRKPNLSYTKSSPPVPSPPQQTAPWPNSKRNASGFIFYFILFGLILGFIRRCV